MDALSQFMVDMAAKYHWLMLVLVAVGFVSEALPFFKSVPANGVLHSVMLFFKALKSKLVPPQV